MRLNPSTNNELRKVVARAMVELKDPVLVKKTILDEVESELDVITDAMKYGKEPA